MYIQTVCTKKTIGSNRFTLVCTHVSAICHHFIIRRRDIQYLICCHEEQQYHYWLVPFMAGICLCIHWSALHSHYQEHDREVNEKQFGADYYNLFDLTVLTDTYRVNRLPWNTARCTLFLLPGSQKKCPVTEEPGRIFSFLLYVNSQNVKVSSLIFINYFKRYGTKKIQLSIKFPVERLHQFFNRKVVTSSKVFRNKMCQYIM